ncbi:TIGR03751 family conjugal transfer lipoprotein [Lelliottia sp. CFBP8978]|uniref:TIGR03751 family conjugal transfer lipoprotein n=1 Tax=Lelliottia sp. CFBP8978 TaxID=3096522 RepID=UPI0012809BAB|nr:TIGR03751 family conjugal transfer lipoprotein [Lelliottia sp. CFBP8978]EBM4472325.1 TIGR03751 family conjugal transfer lipoprotein [Salmonella enterica]EJU7780462.1 TIGR03751 family conjugal transfer lipoprotein [Salmonella enterica subsp. arizonae serovar 56:z36:-]EKD5484615.1 TIGR03751 family conjugal transfer lipoprotein [Salmonella enterica subsp. arizonae]EBM5602557.1 TIGR03751 family conjugal transfer lipoprotein [Salmonella enterica]EBN1283390.1 TIGR03751 family conjugal transfer li
MRILILLLSLLLAACSTDQKTLLPVDENTTMLSIWGKQNNDAQALYDARSVLRRPLDDATLIAQQQQATLSDDNAARALFRRLPNPDLELYIFPHLAGSEGVPVPGYTTVFPFYNRVQYALPGERTDPL